MFEICQQFNNFLERVASYSEDTYGRGMVILDVTSDERRVKDLMAVIHRSGIPTQERVRLVETAFFAEAQDSRLLQAADLICHATRGLVVQRSSDAYAMIERKTDRVPIPEADTIVNYGFRYISSSPPNPPLPFKHLVVDDATGLPKGSFCSVDALERALAKHGL